MLLQDLLSLPTSGIYLIHDDTKMECFIGGSSQLPAHLIQNINRIKSGCFPIKGNNLQFKLVEKLDYINIQEIQVRVAYWHDLYVKQGYKVKSRLSTVVYKPQVKIGDDNLVYTFLVSKGYRKLLIGKFNSIHTAREFVETHYPDNQVYKIHYHPSILSGANNEV